MARADVVIIGAGISGLMAAAFASLEGREVVLLEQAAAPGGCIGGFARNGWSFDGGAQSCESLHCVSSAGLFLTVHMNLGVLDVN